MNDLRVEVYGEKEVAEKKRSISKRVAAAGAAAALTLSLFSLVGCIDDGNSDEGQTQRVEKQSPQDEEPSLTGQKQPFWYPSQEEEEPPQYVREPDVLGGSGSWFVSVLERV